MGRRALSPEEKIEAKKRRAITKKAWIENNKEHYKETLHNWYLINKERLYEREKEVRNIKKETKKALNLQFA